MTKRSRTFTEGLPAAGPSGDALVRRYREALAEPAFGALATAFRALLDLPVAFLTVRDGCSVLMLPGAGLSETLRIDREGSFCDVILQTAEPLVVSDALADPRFVASPHVTGALNRIRFYVGIPLATSSGHVLGTLCGYDTKPRAAPNPDRMRTVTALARASLKRLELEVAQTIYRGREAALSRRTEILETTLNSIGQGVTAFDGERKLQVVNGPALDALCFPPELAFVGQDFQICAEVMAEQGLYGDGEPKELARRRTEETRQAGSFDFERTLRNGRSVRLRGVPLSKGGFLTTYTDLTQVRSQDVALAYRSRYFRWQGAIGMLANAAQTVDDALSRYLSFSCEDLAYDIGHVWSLGPAGDLVSTGLVHRHRPGPALGDRAALRQALRHPSRLARRAVLSDEATVIAEAETDFGDLAPFLPEGAVAGFATRVRISSDIYVVEFFGSYPITPKPSHKSLVAHLEAELSRVAERQRVERLKDEFVSSVGMDLIAPLSSVRAALSRLPRDVLSEEGRAMLAVAEVDGLRLAHLVDNLVAIHGLDRRADIPCFRPEDAADLLARSVLNQAAPSRVRVSADLGLCTLTEARSVVQIVHNLLSNALKFSPDGSLVDLEASRRDGRIRIAVRDRGPGIPEAFRSSLFTRFAQADSSDTRRIGGTGLGLAVAKRLADRLGGALAYETACGSGTTFLFDLPASPALFEAA